LLVITEKISKTKTEARDLSIEPSLQRPFLRQRPVLFPPSASILLPTTPCTNWYAAIIKRSRDWGTRHRVSQLAGEGENFSFDNASFAAANADDATVLSFITFEYLNEVADALRRRKGKCIWLICTILM